MTASNESAELARLRAELAEAKAAAAAAEAKAARARAEAAAAALIAAGAAAAAPGEVSADAAQDTPAPAVPNAEPSATTGQDEAPPANAVTGLDSASSPGALTGYAAEVAAGYRTHGQNLTLGVLKVDDVPEPRALIGLPLSMLNRHGLVAGATGTGKTRTLQLMAEGLSDAGVSVFLTDIKGDLTGLLVDGPASDTLTARTAALGQDWAPASFPVEMFTLGGHGTGTPIRTTVTDFGPLLLSKVLGLNETQQDSLALVFHWADQQGLALLDLKDLRATLAYLTGDGKDELKSIGGVSSATAGVILRNISALEAQGGGDFFGEPAFDTTELLRTDTGGRGVISALQLPALQDRPGLFSTFVMWLLADLFGSLPEVGDATKPKLVFFFDEAHLLFADASDEFLDQVVRTVRLIRSKGVGIVFVTQSPTDVPDEVLAQLGARVQHALRAFTPADADRLAKAARTFPTSPYDLTQVLPSLGTGEAVVTVLSEHGSPTPVAVTRLWAPRSAMSPAPADAVEQAAAASPLAARYATPVDRESAFELLTARAAADEAAAQAEQQGDARSAEYEARERELRELQEKLEKEARGESSRKRDRDDGRRSSRSRKRSSRNVTGNAVLDNFLRSAGTQLGREITRSIFGTRRRR